MRSLLVVLGLICLVNGEALAQPDDLPATLPDDDYHPALAHDDMPSTLPDNGPPPEPDSPPPPLRFEATVNAALSVPVAHNPDVVGFGFAATYGVGWGDIPLALGVDFINIGSIGDADSELNLSLMDMTQVAERHVNTRLMHFDAWLRLQPAHFPVRPYAEGFFGAQLFQGRWVMRVGNAESERAQADEWTRNFGWGFGVEILGFLSRGGGMSLTLGMRRVYASTVKVSRSVVIANERVQSHYEADTSVLLFMLGVGLHYDLADPPARDSIGR